jgi:hypothetical protein
LIDALQIERAMRYSEYRRDNGAAAAEALARYVAEMSRRKWAGCAARLTMYAQVKAEHE